MPRDWPHPDDPEPSRLLIALSIVAATVLTLAPIAGCATRLLAAAPAVPPRGTPFTCRPIAVWDGDGPIWCAEGPRLRLAGVNARELDGSCRPRARCPAISGIAARDVLVRLLGGAKGRLPHGHVRVSGPTMRCRSLGPDKYRRTLASCRLGAKDLAALLTARGAVRR